jgi:NADPH:quinone reductase-like Zn-dependent oxidoreductase
MTTVKKPRRRRLWKVLGLAVLVALPAGFAMLWFDEPDPLTNRSTGESMQAIVYDEYGTAEVLRLADVDKLQPNDDQVLIRIRAAATNPLDWHYIRGTPYIMRLGNGMRRPHDTRLGADMAGEVVAVGNSVTQYKPGDPVYGTADATFAEFALAYERWIAPKPTRLTFEQAAAVPVAALTALQALRDKGKIKAGQKVLINGASGGVGTFAVQIAKSYGAEVTGVCSTRNVEMVRALGADHVIDYTREDFTEGGKRYDLILDNVGIHPLSAFRAVLEEKGTLVLVGGGGPDAGNWIGPLARPIKALLMSPFVDQEIVMLMARLHRDDLLVVKDLIDSGKVTPVIDRTYPLDKVPDAIRYLEEGHARGKVIITIATDAQP